MWLHICVILKNTFNRHFMSCIHTIAPFPLILTGTVLTSYQTRTIQAWKKWITSYINPYVLYTLSFLWCKEQILAILLNSKYIYNTFQNSFLQLLKAIIHPWSNGIIREIVLISLPNFLASNDKSEPTVYRYIYSLKTALSSWGSLSNTDTVEGKDNHFKSHMRMDSL